MLIVLVGGTLEVAKKSREYFSNKGYSVIQKYNYLPEDSLSYHYDTYKNHDEKTVMQCDFVYSIHGGKTGFYKSQILDAVRGRSNALITMSPDSLDFVREIVDSFGEYVVPIYMYIDSTSLETMTRKYVKDEIQVNKRLKKGAMLRSTFLANMNVFDKTVIYSEGGEFGFDALYSQFDLIIKEAEELQKRLNNRLYVDLPYTGTLDYVFVSYSHKDDKKVIPYLSALQREGYRVWYDEGIHKGNNWLIMLGERIKGCKNFLLFSSEHSAASERVEDEINGAIRRRDLHPITVRLDSAEFPYGYEMFLDKYQNIFASEGKVLEQICQALSPTTKE